MTIGEAYLSFIKAVETNIGNDGFHADRERFVMTFNEAQIKYVEWALEKLNEDDRRAVQILLQSNKPLKSGGKQKKFDSFLLPEDYLEFVNIHAVATSSGCGHDSIKLWEVKPENIEELWHDEFNKPSFKYRETFYTIGNGRVNIYKDKFNITSANLTYYRYPRPVDMEGYIRADGSTSGDVDPEWDDRAVNRIITICAKDYSANEGDIGRYQTANNQIISKF